MFTFIYFSHFRKITKSQNNLLTHYLQAKTLVYFDIFLFSGMATFFELAEQFHTQNEPAYCALGTLVMVLNALHVDPGRMWKGPWRWFSEEMLVFFFSLCLYQFPTCF